MPDTPTALAAALADQYRIERTLGEGGTARVYLATDLRHDRSVALKVLRPELASRVGADRFLAEIRTTANLEHPHILPLFDSGEAAGFLYYVMPHVDGESLRDRLDRGGPLPVAEATSIARDVASALAHAHRQGIVHRDVKPANVLLGEGGARVADFGLALALAKIRDERLTAAGLSVGTPGYMSPEQIEGGSSVDPRSDVYALGCLLFEMLSGRPPFEAPTLQGLMAMALSTPAPPVRTIRPEVPGPVADAVARALEKDPGRRFQAIDAFAEALAPAPPTAPRSGRPLVVVLTVAALVLGVGGFLAWQAVQRASARAALPEIGRLVGEGLYGEAYALVENAERWIPDDPTLMRYLHQSTDLLTVGTTPEGAAVSLQRYDPAATAPPEPELLGTTPVEDRRILRGTYRLTVEREGFGTLERVISTTLQREAVPPEVGRRVALELTLTPLDALPPDMVTVAGGTYTLTSPGAPPEISHELGPFFVDRYEVTNEAYAEFVDAGGYGIDALWPDVPAAIRATLVDRTGLAGPRDWVSQRYPDGLDRHPVSSVSWYEARAFCLWAEKRLPSIFEWEKTARDGGISRFGVRMPWGFVNSASRSGLPANFGSDGTLPVDAHPFGISPWGAWAMAGNVREWLANPSGDRRTATGGSWQGPAYVWAQYAVEPADYASPDLGLRCVRSVDDGDPGSGPLKLDPPPPEYTPVDRATFEGFLDHYRYDPIPPRPRLSEAVEDAAWTRERTWIDGPGGDSLLVYTWIPKAASAPFQTVLYVGSSATFWGMRTVPEETERTLGPVIRAGRAVMAPVLTGMAERPFALDFEIPEPPTVAFRDLMVLHATETRRALDYAQIRDDLDTDALTYAAFSFGGGSRLPLSAVDDRYAAVIYIGGGIDERVKPTVPEADNVNFAPYVDAPKLMINGANDEEHPWRTRGQALWALLSEPKELVLVDGAGHLPPLEARIPAINDFLDRTLGPVAR